MDRTEIIAEIRRTAGENSGKPLGQNRFTTETGIRPHEWNRHWPRWSEAVREAGFEPNSVNQALAESDLLEKLAMFVRELGHFPTYRELAIKGQAANFAHQHTYREHFGGLRQLASALQAFSAHRGYGDVANLCARIPEASIATKSQTSVKDSELGFVYLMKSGRFHKIGRSNAVGRRERELAIQLPERAKLVHSIRTDDPPGIEEYWHKRFGERRKNGEWFELTAADVSAFRRRKFM